MIDKQKIYRIIFNNQSKAEKRMLRVFRVLRMVRFSREGLTLLKALKSSMYKIGIFFFSVLCFVTILGTVMYVVEGPGNGFSSIFQSIYWAIITITTVGYGDIVPQTITGKFIASIIMIIGYAIIAVPTGIVTVELSRASSASTGARNAAISLVKMPDFAVVAGQKWNKTFNKIIDNNETNNLFGYFLPYLSILFFSNLQT